MGWTMTTGTRATVLKDEDLMGQRMSVGRPTIGLLTHGPGDPNNRAIWSAAAHVARENGVNLICFPGKPLRSTLEFEAQSNVIFDLVNPEIVDALCPSSRSGRYWRAFRACWSTTITACA
jgi:hypothetical protein